MEWLDYCEHCGSTKEPKVVVSGKATLDENTPKEQKTMLPLEGVKNAYVCSECGREMKVKE